MIKSFKERTKARLGVSVAEVGDTERLQVATLAVSVVSGDAGVCHELLGQVRNWANTLPEAILADARSEVLSFGRDGEGLGLGLRAQRASDKEHERGE